MTNRKARILNGIKFFKGLASRNYNAIQVKNYLPVFLKLVEAEITGVSEDSTEELIKKAEEVFGAKAV